VAKGVDSCGDALIDFLESIQRLLKPLDIFIQIPRTPAMDETVVRIMMELLAILALLTKELKQGRSSKSVHADVLHQLNSIQRDLYY
jgi:hypothetical protein